MSTKTRLLPYLAASALVHGGAVALIIALVSQQESSVRLQEKLVMEDVTTLERKEAERSEAEEQKAERDLLAEQVRQEVETAIREQVPDPVLAEALAKVADAKLEGELAKAEQEKALSARTEAERQELADQLKEAALTDLRDHLDDFKHDALAEDIAKYVQEKAAPALKTAVEKELAKRAADQLKRDLAKAANDQIKPGDLAKADAAKRAATDAAADKATTDTKPAIDKAVTDKAIPAAAAALAKAAADSAREQGLPAIDTAALTNEIKDQLAKAMANDPATAQAALTPAREAQGSADAAAIAKAAAAVDSAAAALAAAAKQESAIGAQVADAAKASGAARDTAIANAAAQQAAASAAIAQGNAAAIAALDQASAATGAASDSRNNARNQAASDKAQRPADAAKANLDHGATADASGNLANAAKAAAETAAALTAAAKDLHNAAAAAAKAQASAAALSDAVGSSAAGKAVDAMAASASSTIAAKAGEAASAAGKQTDGNGLKQALGQSATAGAMAQLSALKDKLSSTLGDKNAAAAARASNGVGALSSAALKGGDSAAASSSGAGNGPGNGPGSGPGAAAGSTIRATVKVATYGGAVSNVREQADFNRAAYEAFVKDLRERANPNNFYAGAGVAGAVGEGRGSQSRATGRDGARIVFVPSAGEAKPATPPIAANERQVAKPAFASPAFGAAPLQQRPLTIDGDLSDWGTLTQPLTTPYNVYKAEKDGQSGPAVYMRWAPDGLYFAWRIDMDPADIIGTPDHPYAGDCLELFIDVDNSRKGSMQNDKFAQQICLDPFGFQGDMKKTVCEIGHDMRGIPRHTVQWRDDGRAAAKRDAKGYTAEAFVPRLALAKRKLLPGDFIAFNVSVNRGLRDWKANPEAMYALQRQSSASKVIGSWQKPDTWGDMQLLGSDAQATISALHQRAENAPAFVAPGDPVQVEVRDADMNLSPYVIDKVLGQVRVQGSSQQPIYVTMVETGANTGVFRASLDTQSYLLPFVSNTVGVRGGDVIDFNYVDARGAFGEADRTSKATIEVGYAMVVTKR